MKKSRKIILILSLILLFCFATVFLLYYAYISPVANGRGFKSVKIESGMSTLQIGKVLEENQLIKDAKFFTIYLKINRINDLKAGTYKLDDKMSLKEIVAMIRQGNNYNADEITLTFKEGINFRQLAQVIADNTSNKYEDVLATQEDKNYLNSLIEDYWFITDDILNEDLYYPLEGYLFPDTYKFRDKNVQITEIFKKLLDQMGIVLEPYKTLIQTNTMSIHEILTLASMAEKEVNNSNDRSKVASVFLNRIAKKMALGSDVTTRYGLKIDEKRALSDSEYKSENPYNTRNSNLIGLPAGPVGMVSKSSIEAALKPDETNYLYFISNIQTDETFFFETSKEFEAKKAELKDINNGY